MSSPLPPSSPPPPSTPNSDPFGFDALERKLKENTPPLLQVATPRVKRHISISLSSSTASLPSTPSPTKGKARDKQITSKDEDEDEDDLYSTPPKKNSKPKTRLTIDPKQDPKVIAKVLLKRLPPRRSARVKTKGTENDSAKPNPKASAKGKATTGKRKRADAASEDAPESPDPNSDISPPKRRRSTRLAAPQAKATTTKSKRDVKPKPKPTKKPASKRESKKVEKPLAEQLDLEDDEREEFERERQARIDYFKKLETYAIPEEKVYIV